jgi:hypothetical protein
MKYDTNGPNIGVTVLHTFENLWSRAENLRNAVGKT